MVVDIAIPSQKEILRYYRKLIHLNDYIIKSLLIRFCHSIKKSNYCIIITTNK
jgi:hypothetical protein